MKKFLKIFAVLFICFAMAFIVKYAFNYDFFVSGIDLIFVVIGLFICNRMGLLRK